MQISMANWSSSVFCGLPRKFARRYHWQIPLSTNGGCRGLSQMNWAKSLSRDPTRHETDLSIAQVLIKSQIWQLKVQLVTFLPRSAVSLFPAWDNCYRVDC